MEKLRPSLQDLPFSSFLVIPDLIPPLEAGLWGGDGSLLRASPGAKLTWAFGLRKRLVELMSPDWHPAYLHTTCGLSHPCPYNLE